MIVRSRRRWLGIGGRAVVGLEGFDTLKPDLTTALRALMRRFAILRRMANSDSERQWWAQGIEGAGEWLREAERKERGE